MMDKVTVLLMITMVVGFAVGYAISTKSYRSPKDFSTLRPYILTLPAIILTAPIMWIGWDKQLATIVTDPSSYMFGFFGYIAAAAGFNVAFRRYQKRDLQADKRF